MHKPVCDREDSAGTCLSSSLTPAKGDAFLYMCTCVCLSVGTLGCAVCEGSKFLLGVVFTEVPFLLEEIDLSSHELSWHMAGVVIIISPAALHSDLTQQVSGGNSLYRHRESPDSDSHVPPHSVLLQFFETSSYYAAQVGLELIVPRLQALQCCEDKL